MTRMRVNLPRPMAGLVRMLKSAAFRVALMKSLRGWLFCQACILAALFFQSLWLLSSGRRPSDAGFVSNGICMLAGVCAGCLCAAAVEWRRWRTRRPRRARLGRKHQVNPPLDTP